MSGRIQLPPSATGYSQTTNDHLEGVPDHVLEATALNGKFESTEVSRLYFSKKNMDALQLGIRNMVYEKSCEKKYIIGKQSANELLVIMRYIFFENSRNNKFDVLQQVRDLNMRVLSYAVPRILSELDMYHAYRRDIQNGPQFMDRGISTSVAGTKTLEMGRW